MHGGGVVGEQQRRAGAGDFRAAVLAFHPATDGSTELLSDQLGAVTDTEDRDPEFVDRWIERRCTLDVHALGPTRQHDRRRLAFVELGGGDVVRDDFGVDLQFAHSAGDQLRVLRPEIDDDDGVPLGGLRLNQDVHRRAALAVGLVLFALAVALPAAVTAHAANDHASIAAIASPVDDTVPPVTDNEFLPDERNLSDCLGALQRPGCGSEARGGWRQTLVFVIMGVAMVGVFGRVAYGVYRGRKQIDQAV